MSTGTPASFNCANIEKIPNELKEMPRWLLWDINKKPIYANGKPRATNTVLDNKADADQLVTFDQIIIVFKTKNFGRYHGVGLALGGFNAETVLQGYELDDISKNGFDDLARQICSFENYVELSPGGFGIHVLGVGRPFATLGSNGSGIEAYAKSRYFTVSGNALVGGAETNLGCLASFVEQHLAPLHTSQKKAHSSPQQSPTPHHASPPQITLDPKIVTELRSALNQLSADDYHQWINIGQSLRELGDTGLELWRTWSQTSDKYDPTVCTKKWHSFHPSEISYQTVFHTAQTNGWVNPNSKVNQYNLSPVKSDDYLITQTMAEIDIAVTDWIWPQWIAKGAVTMLAGESAIGKSTIMNDIEARIMTGKPWPGLENKRPIKKVLVLSSEDDPARTIKPKLIAAGVGEDQMNNMIIINGTMRQKNRLTFSIGDDLPLIRNELDKAIASGVKIDLIEINPVTAYLTRHDLKKVDCNDNGQIRSILEPLSDLAQEYNIAIICISHFTKDKSKSLTERILNSVAFNAVGRISLAIIATPDKGEKCGALLQLKTNISESIKGGYCFKMKKKIVGSRKNEDGLDVNISTIYPEWTEIDLTISEESEQAKNSKFGHQGHEKKFRDDISDTRKANLFKQFLVSYFKKLPDGEYEITSEVKKAAVAYGVTNEFWKYHSSKYLEHKKEYNKNSCKPNFNIHDVIQ